MRTTCSSFDTRPFAMLVMALVTTLMMMSTPARADTPQARGNAMHEALPACPDAPHCVSSLETREDRQVAPLRGGDSLASAEARLTALLDELPRVDWTRIVTGDAIHIHAVFRTRLMRFRDDVNFWIQPDGMIQVRSSSRIGYHDMGANRRRVEQLREALETAPHAAE
ncbi:DUF1499 domain-containing protein [Isoalcanivorax indicus]|uniref:DUF1499 domain-containing protein n=1 Tax=Isoalcanivorax indicus TaxID=2202653 RepID=UPI0013C42480|nr:DUF1499 domain-containing protein [Isoalcanivorax indicus]